MKIILSILSILFISNCFAQDSPEVQKAVEEVKIEARPVYTAALALINELKQNVELAKKGLKPKAEVINSYNKKVGANLGRRTTLLGVEKRLNEAGETYAQMLYLREQSRLLFKRAAEEKAKSEAKH